MAHGKEHLEILRYRILGRSQLRRPSDHGEDNVRRRLHLDQVVASQALFAALLFAVALLVQRARGKRLVPLSLKQTIALLALGLNTCIGTVLYNYALTLLPVSVAITLLFQFT